MKFGKLIQALVDAALPTWKDKFLPYKYLKKRLNALIGEILADSILRDERIAYATDGRFSKAGHENEPFLNRLAAEGTSQHVTTTEFRQGRKRGRVAQDSNGKRRRLFDTQSKRLLEAEFKRLLENELNKLNEFVVEKEEEFVIKLQDFKEKVERCKDMIRANDENHLDVINLRKDVVVFYGEMVLLKNYSTLNYTGLVKIVKKHDRLTGAWLRLSFIPDVLRQPFFSTEILSRLVRDCESNMLLLFPSSGETADHSFEEDTRESAFQDDSLFSEKIIKEIYTSTTAAWQIMQDMSRGSSTYNVFSVPPCEDDDDDVAGSVVDEDTLEFPTRAN